MLKKATIFLFLLNLCLAASAQITSLNDLIQEAVSKNPVLLSLGYQITAQSARSEWIKVKPDPMFTNSTNTDKYPFRYQSLGEDPMNQVQFALGQEFPFPGKLKLKGKIEFSELERIKQNYNLAKVEIISRLKKAYYDLFLTTKSLEITKDVKTLLETLSNTVKAKYEVGNGNQQDLLKAHLEVSKLLEQVEILKKDRESFIAEINSIVVRPQGTDIESLEEISKQEIDYSQSELEELAKEEYPLLLSLRKEIEKNQHGVNLAKKEYFPNYSVEGGYGLRTGLFEPMYTVQLMTSVPLYFYSKQRKQVEEAVNSLKAAEENHHSIIVETQARVKDLFIQIEKNATLIDLLKTGIIPQAKLTLDASIAAYKVDKTDFLNVLDNIRAILDFQIDYYSRLTAYEKLAADLEVLIGREL